jgi:beta-galactosidase
MGFYVMDEVSIGHGEKNLDKPEYRDNILARVEPTIVRDKNRPSVLIWSIGNENPINEAELEAGPAGQAARPVAPDHLSEDRQLFRRQLRADPGVRRHLRAALPGNATLAELCAKLKRPTILTEYAHALGLATDRMQASGS